MPIRMLILCHTPQSRAQSVCIDYLDSTQALPDVFSLSDLSLLCGAGSRWLIALCAARRYYVYIQNIKLYTLQSLELLHQQSSPVTLTALQLSQNLLTTKDLLDIPTIPGIHQSLYKFRNDKRPLA